MKIMPIIISISAKYQTRPEWLLYENFSASRAGRKVLTCVLAKVWDMAKIARFLNISILTVAEHIKSKKAQYVADSIYYQHLDDLSYPDRYFINT